jgi:tetratricopeptide (TPR) repeat protein
MSAQARLMNWIVLAVLLAVHPALALAQTQADLVKLQELFSAANTLMGKGDTLAAIQKYSEAISIAPSVPAPYVNRGVAYVSLSKNSEALSDADKALSLLESGSFPRSLSAIAYQVKGTVYQNQGNYPLAIESFSKSIELEPSNAKFWNNRGNAYRFLNKYDEALKDYDKAIELDANFSMFFINRGSVYLKQKSLDASLRDLNEAVRLDKGNESAYYSRANTYVELRKFDEALSDYSQALLLKTKPEFYYGRGRLYFLRGQYELALKDNSDALALDPSNPNMYGNRALCYARLGKDSLAVEDIRSALALKKESVLLRYNLAYFLYKTGQYAEAAAEASKVIDMAPRWQSSYNLRAAIFAKLGNAVKAKADRDTAAKLGPGNKPQEDVTFFELEIIAPEVKDKPPI